MIRIACSLREELNYDGLCKFSYRKFSRCIHLAYKFLFLFIFVFLIGFVSKPSPTQGTNSWIPIWPHPHTSTSNPHPHTPGDK